MGVVGGRHIRSIDIFYNGQCSIKLSSSPLYHIYCYLLCHETYHQLHLSVCTRFIRLMLLLLPHAQVSLMLPWLGLYIWWWIY